MPAGVLLGQTIQFDDKLNAMLKGVEVGIAVGWPDMAMGMTGFGIMQ